MKNLIISTLLAAAASSSSLVHAAPAPGSPLNNKERLASLLTERSGYLANKDDIAASTSSSFSRYNKAGSSYPLAHSQFTGEPITVKFGSTKNRHKQLPKKKKQATAGSAATDDDGDDDSSHRQKRQEGSDNESELLNFDDTRYIACESSHPFPAKSFLPPS